MDKRVINFSCILLYKKDPGTGTGNALYLYQNEIFFTSVKCKNGE